MSAALRRLRDRSPESFLIVSCILGYWIVAHVFADFYPISPLGMFRDKMSSSSRIVARPVGSEPIEISYFVDWHCDQPLDFSNAAHPRCPRAGFSAYDAIVADYILSHQGPPQAGVAVDIVRRQFTIPEPYGPTHYRDCRLLSCTARRVEPSRWIPRL